MLSVCLQLIVCITLLYNSESAHLSQDNYNENEIRSKANYSLRFLNWYESLKSIKDPICQHDLNATLSGIINGIPWAIAMYDASVWEPVGISSGILHQFGHYDQCLQQKLPLLATTYRFRYDLKEENMEMTRVEPKYCLAEVITDEMQIEQNRALSDWQIKRNDSEIVASYWGVCVPLSCSADDITQYLRYTLQRPAIVTEARCQYSKPDLHVTDGMLIYALIILVFVFLALLSTGYHLYLIYWLPKISVVSKTNTHDETLNMALLTFSLIENTKKLFQASKDQWNLNAIHGIKSLAMLLILCGHSLTFLYGSPAYNVEFMNEKIKFPIFAFLPNSLLFVDVFLLLSGFLFTRILLIELEKRAGRINVLVLYAARYIRLTPAYLAIIGFYIYWFPMVGDGPLWPERILREQRRCQSSWWLNILYINNYFNTDQLCMFQSWYLCVDSQLFFLAPIIIYLLFKSRKLGLYVLSVLLTITSIIPILITYVQELDPTLMIYPDKTADLNSNDFYKNSYIKTHMRLAAYIIGLLTGYLVHKMHTKKTQLPTWLVKICWLASVAIGVSSMFTITRFYISPYNNMESSMYSGLHKLGWSLSVAWLVIAVTTKHAGWLQKVLSHRLFAPISRLTYCAYLCNGIVELYHSSTMRMPTYMSYINLFNVILAHILDTFLLAFLVCLLFESPIHALERILLKKFSEPNGHLKESPQLAKNVPKQTKNHPIGRIV